MPYKDPEQQRAYKRLWRREERRRRRAFGIEKLGGRCTGCGVDDESVLTFHHIDKGKKTFWFGRMTEVSMRRFTAELEHVELLCKTCHDEHHAREGHGAESGAAVDDEEWDEMVSGRGMPSSWSTR